MGLAEGLHGGIDDALALIQSLAQAREPLPRSSGPLGHRSQPNSVATPRHFMQSEIGYRRGRASTR